MNVTCKNCGVQVEGKFCSRCGQLAATRPLDWKFLWEDLQRLFSPQDNTFYATIKALFVRPGDFIVEYLEGKRVGHLGPLKLVLALATINLGLMQTYHLLQANRANSAAQQWIYSHYGLTELALVPLMALASFVGFRRARFPLAWHFGIAGYLVSQQLVIRLGTISLAALFHYTRLRLVLVVPQAGAAIFATWAYFRIFDSLTVARRVGGILATFALFGASLFLLILAFAQAFPN